MAVQAPPSAGLKNTTAITSKAINPAALSSTSHVGGGRRADRLALNTTIFSSPLQLSVSSPLKGPVSSAGLKISMRLSSKQSYICRDCGYIYNDRIPFEKQPDKYYCPVCAAPKRRFRVYEPPVTKNANATDVRKARKEQLQKDEAIGRALPIAIVVGVVALVGLYFYLNNVF